MSSGGRMSYQSKPMFTPKLEEVPYRNQPQYQSVKGKDKRGIMDLITLPAKFRSTKRSEGDIVENGSALTFETRGSKFSEDSSLLEMIKEKEELDVSIEKLENSIKNLKIDKNEGRPSRKSSKIFRGDKVLLLKKKFQEYEEELQKMKLSKVHDVNISQITDKSQLKDVPILDLKSVIKKRKVKKKYHKFV